MAAVAKAGLPFRLVHARITARVRVIYSEQGEVTIFEETFAPELKLDEILTL